MGLIYDWDMDTRILIEALKKALKSKGINYEELAKMLGISRASVKRIFYQGTFTLDRFVKICNLLDISLPNLMQMMDVELEGKEFELPLEQEEFFAINFNYWHFYTLLFRYKSIPKLVKDYHLDENTLVKILAKLDEFKLIEWLPGNKDRYRRWRHDNQH